MVWPPCWIHSETMDSHGAMRRRPILDRVDDVFCFHLWGRPEDAATVDEDASRDTPIDLLCSSTSAVGDLVPHHQESPRLMPMSGRKRLSMEATKPPLSYTDPPPPLADPPTQESPPKHVGDSQSHHTSRIHGRFIRAASAASRPCLAEP